MLYKFTKSGEKVINIANELAEDFGHNYIGTEHILYGLAFEENGVARKILENQNITSDDILEKIQEIVGTNSKANISVLGFTPRTKKILEKAYYEAKKLGSNYVGTEHILVGILKERDCIAIRILLELDINIDNMYIDIAKTLNEFEKNMQNDNKEIDDTRKFQFYSNFKSIWN